MSLLTSVYLHLGKRIAACAQIEQIVSLEQQVGFDVIQKWNSRRRLRGAMALADGAHARACAHFQKSLAVQEPDVVWDWNGLAARGMGRRAETWERLIVELRKAVEFRRFTPLMFALSGLALLLADEGEAERALELYALAARHPVVANSRWYKHIVAVAATLPPEVVAAAQERGRARDLEAAVAELLIEAGQESCTPVRGHTGQT